MAAASLRHLVTVVFALGCLGCVTDGHPVERWVMAQSGDRAATDEPQVRSDLPDNPSRAQTAAFVREIIELSSARTHLSSRDMELELLAGIPPGQLDVLLTEAESAPADFKACYIPHVARRLAGPDNKDILIESLDTYPALVNVVLDMGWQDDARDMLLNGLASGRPLPVRWIQTLASFNEPAANEGLLHQLEISADPVEVYYILKDLPMIRLRLMEVARARWHELMNSHEDSMKAAFAPIAVDYGSIEALDTLVSLLGSEVSYEIDVPLCVARSAGPTLTLGRSTAVAYRLHSPQGSKSGHLQQTVDWEPRCLLHMRPDVRLLVDAAGCAYRDSPRQSALLLTRPDGVFLLLWATPRTFVVAYTEQTGTDEEIQRWYRDHREKIVFDGLVGKFRLASEHDGTLP